MPYINSDQVKEKRNAIKKAFPEFKFSITRDNHSGIRIVVLEGPVWFANDGDHDQVNPYHINGKNDRQNEALEKMYAIANSENGTEVMDSDYGRVPNFYVWMEIGRWDKPYKVREEKKAEAKDEDASIKFEAGKSYFYTFIGDSSLKVKVTIVRRTEKTIWFTVRNETEVRRAKVNVRDGVESFAPDGTGYSMFPTCYASKVMEEVQPEAIQEEDTVKIELNEINCEEMSAEQFGEKAKEFEAQIDIDQIKKDGFMVIPGTKQGQIEVDYIDGLFEVCNTFGEVLIGNATEDDLASFLKEISGLDTEEEKPEPESAPELSFHSVFGGMGERKPIETEGMLLHKYLDAATRAHNGVSFDPERRGKQYVRDYSNLLAEDLKEVEKYGGDTERYREKFERLFLDWMGSKANCISSMITGPARFPTARAQKRNDWERNKANALEDWRQRAIKAIKKKHKRENAPDPMQAAKRKFHQEEAMLERMKSANKVIKSNKLSEEDKISRLLDQGFSEGSARNLLTPDFANRIGFASWQLTNCRNRMKSAQAKVEELERRANTPDVEQEREDGIKVVENAAENRLQVFFPGKPEYEMRQKLKSNGFRWAPSKGCWQAYLNNRSIEKLANILD